MFPKHANCEDFLTKFVNINNHNQHFLHGVVIFQEAKNYSQHEEIFAAFKKNWANAPSIYYEIRE